MSESQIEPVEPATEIITVADQPVPPLKPVREISQAAIASFFYGTLQLLTTMIGAVIVVALTQSMKAFQSPMPAGSNGVSEGTDTADLAELQKMMEELQAADPSLIPAPTTPPVTPDISTIPQMPTVPTTPAMPSIPGFKMEGTPDAIVTHEFFLIFLTQGFGLMGLLTASIAISAVMKGKSGLGLAVTGLVSSALSLFIAFIVAMAV